MEIESLADALEREHHEIDDGIEAFAAGPAPRDRDPAPLRTAIRELRRHIYLEEEFLFPLLRRGGLAAAILVMLREHGQIWATLDALESDVTAAASDTVLMLCHQLAVQLQHHNLKEERIVYPQADETLPIQERARLRELLATGELPDGWVCQRASAGDGRR